MFFERGGLSVGSASVRSAIVIARELYVYATRRSGVCYDSRFVLPVKGAAREMTTLYVVLSGEVEWRRAAEPDEPPRRAVGPIVLAMPEHFFEGALGAREVELHACGAHFVAADVRLRSSVLARAPSHLETWPCGEEVERAARAFVEAATGEAGQADVERALVGAIRAMEGAGWIREPLSGALLAPDEGAPARMWRALGEAFRTFDAGIVSKTLAGAMGISGRQFFRLAEAVSSTMVTPPAGWREMVRQLRSKLAVMLLSAPDLSVSEIAEAVGYRRAEAMTNAFQRDGLPSPTRVRELVRAVHDAR